MQEKKELVVGGFQFGTPKDVPIAQKEVQKIELLESRMDYSNPEQVYIIYESAIQNRVFETPIGYTYLHSLQDYLVEHPLEGKEVRSIPLFMSYSQSMREKTEPAKKRVEPKRPKDKLKISITINILLVIMVIVMFVITLTSKNPNILNYENALVNKYAAWEQELTKRESVVKEKERELKLSE